MTLTPDTARAVRELAEDMGISEEEVVEKAVRGLAMLRATLWTPSPRKLAAEKESE